MDAVKFLKQQHDEVEELFQRFEATSDGAEKTRADLAERITADLDVHAQIEEEIFYPAVREQGGKLADLVEEGEEEHGEAKQLIGAIKRITEDATLKERVNQLAGAIRHHVKEEENEMFPKYREQIDAATLEELGERLEARAKELEAQA